MPGANLIFHITSAALLLGLVLALLRLKNQRDFLRKLIASSFGQPSLIVDYPSRFFNNFAVSCNIDLDGNSQARLQSSSDWNALQKIRPLELIQLHSQLRIKSMAILPAGRSLGHLLVHECAAIQQNEQQRPNKVDLGFAVLDVEFEQKRNTDENK